MSDEMSQVDIIDETPKMDPRIIIVVFVIIILTILLSAKIIGGVLNS
ncbi:MAG: hypothetical protein K0A90_07760 [Methanosarcinaceae archaeon]|nr:hypothetical protein [Methanosarcinaceae archaeon]